MIRRNKLNTTAMMAISAAILCSSSASFAQETAPVPTVQPAAPAPVAAPPLVVQTAPEVAPVATTVAPPPAVRTIPDSELGQAVAPAPRAAATERPAPRRTAASQKAALPAVEASPVTSPPVETTVGSDFAPTSDDIVLGDVNVEETGTIVPVDGEAPVLADGAQDDWMLYGGLAAALGLAGLGGVIASRRRRTRQSEYREVERTAPAAVPVNDYPTALPLAAARTTPRIITPSAAQPTVSDRNLPPVTDPLFAHQAELGPVTDPLFSQTIEMPPVTDPMFADKAEYVGGPNAGAAFDTRRTWGDKPTRELEPAE